MDFKSYYLNQADGSVFRGAAFQKGYGLGGAFRRFFTWFLPLLKEHTLPIAKNFGKEIVQNVANIANDAINGENIEESAKKHVENSMKKINQSGKGYIKKRNLKNTKLKSNLKNKRLIDIFG